MSNRLADDRLVGAGQIAEFMEGADTTKNRRKIYALLERKGPKPPIFHVGATLEARKSGILAWYAEQEALASGKVAP